MKKQEKDIKNKMVVVRMSGVEYEGLKKLQLRSTEKYISNYIRKVSLQKPLLIKYRNQSADNFLNEMIELKKELNAIGNNLNQAVKKLHIIERIPEFRFWIQSHQALYTQLISKIEEIKIRMYQVQDQWLQK